MWFNCVLKKKITGNEKQSKRKVIKKNTAWKTKYEFMAKLEK